MTAKRIDPPMETMPVVRGIFVTNDCRYRVVAVSLPDDELVRVTTDMGELFEWARPKP